MAEGKKVFNLYTDLIELINGSNVHDVEIEPMTDEEAGKLFKWILEYVNDLHPAVPKEIKYAVVQVKKQLDNDLIRWKKKCEVNQKNGALGGRPRKTEKTQKNPDGFLETQDNPEKPDKDKDKDKDINNDKLINDKSCVRTREKKINLNPRSYEERQILKDALNEKNLDFTVFAEMHKLIKPLYFNQKFELAECITLTDLLDHMDAKYDKRLIARAWAYSYGKSKTSNNPIGYITAILEKNINNLIRKEEMKPLDLKDLEEEIQNGKQS